MCSYVSVFAHHRSNRANAFICLPDLVVAFLRSMSSFNSSSGVVAVTSESLLNSSAYSGPRPKLVKTWGMLVSLTKATAGEVNVGISHPHFNVGTNHPHFLDTLQRWSNKLAHKRPMILSDLHLQDSQPRECSKVNKSLVPCYVGLHVVNLCLSAPGSSE